MISATGQRSHFRIVWPFLWIYRDRLIHRVGLICHSTHLESTLSVGVAVIGFVFFIWGQLGRLLKWVA